MSHQPDNISVGTHLVALVEISGPSKSLLHPRGAMGVVTRAGLNRLLVRVRPGAKDS